MKCEKGHLRKPGDRVCYECLDKKIEEVTGGPVKSPRDKMIKSEDLRRKKYGRKK